MIYLDHLTTTPPLPEVVDAMQPWLRGQFGAPAALHQLGLEARDAIDESRTRLAKLVNAAEPEEILFTSSGTEAINHAVKGAALAKRRSAATSSPPESSIRPCWARSPGSKARASAARRSASTAGAGLIPARLARR